MAAMNGNEMSESGAVRSIGTKMMRILVCPFGWYLNSEEPVFDFIRKKSGFIGI